MPGPIVYSVGRNGVDEGGSRQSQPQFPPAFAEFQSRIKAVRDLVLPLAVQPAVPRDPAAPALA